MTRERFLRLLAACALTLPSLAVQHAHAGTFSVSPVRIFVQARERATAVTVQNEGTTEVVMQADLFRWTQDENGADKLTPTDDLVLAPPILRLAPGTRQVVRLANLRPPPSSQQETYRLIVREVPEAQTQGEAVTVQVALAFSLPVFITPEAAKPLLACSSDGSASAPAVTVTCENAGSAYAQPVSMVLNTGATVLAQNDDIRGGYILPKVKRTFELPAKAPRVPGSQGTLTVTLDDGSRLTFDVRLAD